MRIALIFSNAISISQNTKRGTEIFDYILTSNLVKVSTGENPDITSFASGDADLPVRVESIDKQSSQADKSITRAGKHIIFELALISKAFTMQNNFDLYHVNIGDGDIVLPFAPFVKKPILITLHYTQQAAYVERYFSLFKQFNNIHFVSISNAQRQLFPQLNYAGTIYHGVETDYFKLNKSGGESIMWAGRGIPDKGLSDVFEVLKRIKRKARLFPLRKKEYSEWLQKQILDQQALISSLNILIEFDKDRPDLVKQYQLSKLFLLPIQWEEPFGLVLIESMACGTPVVAYGRGSVPEIIKDGETGFIVNPSSDDIRGNWTVKKTGIEGLCEAVEKIYAMSKKDYQKMRQNCRAHVEKFFTAEQMAKNYLNIYKTITNQKAV